ncbi:hypothetical protein CcaverHIS002_0601230 [Cutaneotrichosporon cavernicola]|nr:hypothetical protein CcaverHIS002_0601230 [Cutaneotrichosporon cavernicola]BEJ00277.1 hypothetical protein CcaverHIS631_0501340 [Cutaneotrichosporon cavernicola]BEJ08047.1 hypothetical protein CcaverHIS641_0501320 [Cutaneotrichosporon cavernicola]
MTFKPHPEDCECCPRCLECNVHCDCPWADQSDDESGNVADDESSDGSDDDGSDNVADDESSDDEGSDSDD